MRFGFCVERRYNDDSVGCLSETHFQRTVALMDASALCGSRCLPLTWAYTCGFWSLLHTSNVNSSIDPSHQPCETAYKLEPFDILSTIAHATVSSSFIRNRFVFVKRFISSNLLAPIRSSVDVSVIWSVVGTLTSTLFQLVITSWPSRLFFLFYSSHNCEIVFYSLVFLDEPANVRKCLTNKQATERQC